eukprot:TRINITY_DN3369_c0_g1_i3.p1 TRINITY_DN3369_c0_g1~~TRINITY_DN3369_c0_g1_i3.p1  ORF type:complete len:1775 (+),score=257.88 TRINITY_DN3369_c0_g1_i3:54-5378(+)
MGMPWSHGWQSSMAKQQAFLCALVLLIHACSAVQALAPAPDSLRAQTVDTQAATANSRSISNAAHGSESYSSIDGGAGDLYSSRDGEGRSGIVGDGERSIDGGRESTAPSYFVGPTLPERVLRVEDVDGDGLDDMVAQRADHLGLVWARNVGEGEFGAFSTFVLQAGVVDYKFADVTGDGVRDVVVTTVETNMVPTPSGGSYVSIYKALAYACLLDALPGTANVSRISTASSGGVRFDCRTEKLVSGIEFTGWGVATLPPYVADLNGDGRPEVCVYTDEVTYCASALRGGAFSGVSRWVHIPPGSDVPPKSVEENKDLSVQAYTPLDWVGGCTGGAHDSIPFIVKNRTAIGCLRSSTTGHADDSITPSLYPSYSILFESDMGPIENMLAPTHTDEALVVIARDAIAILSRTSPTSGFTLADTLQLPPHYQVFKNDVREWALGDMDGDGCQDLVMHARPVSSHVPEILIARGSGCNAGAGLYRLDLLHSVAVDLYEDDFDAHVTTALLTTGSDDAKSSTRKSAVGELQAKRRASVLATPVFYATATTPLACSVTASSSKTTSMWDECGNHTRVDAVCTGSEMFDVDVLLPSVYDFGVPCTAAPASGATTGMKSAHTSEQRGAPTRMVFGGASGVYWAEVGDGESAENDALSLASPLHAMYERPVSLPVRATSQTAYQTSMGVCIPIPVEQRDDAAQEASGDISSDLWRTGFVLGDMDGVHLLADVAEDRTAPWSRTTIVPSELVYSKPHSWSMATEDVNADGWVDVVAYSSASGSILSLMNQGCTATPSGANVATAAVDSLMELSSECERWGVNTARKELASSGVLSALQMCDVDGDGARDPFVGPVWSRMENGTVSNQYVVDVGCGSSDGWCGGSSGAEVHATDGVLLDVDGDGLLDLVLSDIAGSTPYTWPNRTASADVPVLAWRRRLHDSSACSVNFAQCSATSFADVHVIATYEPYGRLRRAPLAYEWVAWAHEDGNPKASASCTVLVVNMEDLEGTSYASKTRAFIPPNCSHIDASGAEDVPGSGGWRSVEAPFSLKTITNVVLEPVTSAGQNTTSSGEMLESSRNMLILCSAGPSIYSWDPFTGNFTSLMEGKQFLDPDGLELTASSSSDSRTPIPGDFNRDGQLDVVLWATSSSPYMVDLSQGTLSLPQAYAQANVSVPGGPFTIVVDVDADGWVDLLVEGRDAISVMRNTNGRFSARVDVVAHRLVSGSTHAADIDNDGFMDLFFGTSGTANSFAGALVKSALGKSVAHVGELWRDGGLFEEAELVTTGPVKLFSSVDLDGDGRRDLLVSNENGNRLYFARQFDGLEWFGWHFFGAASMPGGSYGVCAENPTVDLSERNSTLAQKSSGAGVTEVSHTLTVLLTYKYQVNAYALYGNPNKGEYVQVELPKESDFGGTATGVGLVDVTGDGVADLLQYSKSMYYLVGSPALLSLPANMSATVLSFALPPGATSNKQTQLLAEYLPRDPPVKPSGFSFTPSSSGLPGSTVTAYHRDVMFLPMPCSSVCDEGVCVLQSTGGQCMCRAGMSPRGSTELWSGCVPSCPPNTHVNDTRYGRYGGCPLAVSSCQVSDPELLSCVCNNGYEAQVCSWANSTDVALFPATPLDDVPSMACVDPLTPSACDAQCDPVCTEHASCVAPDSCQCDEGYEAEYDDEGELDCVTPTTTPTATPLSTATATPTPASPHATTETGEDEPDTDGGDADDKGTSVVWYVMGGCALLVIFGVLAAAVALCANKYKRQLGLVPEQHAYSRVGSDEGPAELGDVLQSEP